MNFWGSNLASAHFAGPLKPGRKLVWFEKSAVDVKLQPQDDSVLDDLLLSLETPVSLIDSNNGQQDVFSTGNNNIPSAYLHYRTTTAALVSLEDDKARIIDTLMPPFWKSRLLPAAPVDYIPVPEAAVDHVREVLHKLKFDPLVASVVNNISLPQIKNDIRFLTGEDASSSIVSRHSFSSGALTAANWLKERVEDTGASCRLASFLYGFAPNVIWFVFYAL